MDVYTDASYDISKIITEKYSSSFSLSSRLFSSDIRPHIYAVYGLVRIADEVVDTYKGQGTQQLLDTLEKDTYEAIKRGYSTNPIIHAFALTAEKYHIDNKLIAPFFESMRMDLSPQSYSSDLYESYIHGSAEVVGLACLKVFCTNDQLLYESLRPGATRLGAAYQKVNFLRDLAADYKELGRLYFPGVTFDSFDEKVKSSIEADIQADFDEAELAIQQLPRNSRAAVYTSYRYYLELLDKIKTTPAETIKHTRVRVPTAQKLWILAQSTVSHKLS